MNRIVAAALLSISAGAAADPGPMYMGAAAGRSQVGRDCRAAEPCPKGDRRAGKVYAGYSFAPVSAWAGSELTSALELGLFRADDIRGLYNYTAGIQQAAGSVEGTTMMYRVSIRETDALSLHARIGLAYSRFKLAYSGGPPPQESTRLATGLGLAYALGPNWSLTLDYDHINADVPGGGKLRMLTVGAGYRF